MYLLYDLVLLASASVLVPWYLVRGWRYGKRRRGLRERLGMYLPERLAPLKGKTVFWIHAVSVGETRAAIPLLRELKQAYPQPALVLSNVTETGHAIAGGIKEVDLCLFFPFDLSWAVRRAFRQVNPSLVIIVETEIWPNFVRIAADSGIPVVLVNGRISDRSFPRYRRIKWLLQPVLKRFTAFCMQTPQDAERIRLLGAEQKKIEITRNLKFDMKAQVPDAAMVENLRHVYRLPSAPPIWVAGSTHAGEEEMVADVYRKLLSEGHSLVLVLVPRHPERCRTVAEMLTARGFQVTLRTALDGRGEPLHGGEVLLVDTLGEMLNLYSSADLVFLGGSLVPVGGHNVLEASLVKKPVIFGPYMHNFKEISSLLLDACGGIQIVDGDGLHEAVLRLLHDPELRVRMGEGGHALIRQNSGATQHTLAVIGRTLVG